MNAAAEVEQAALARADALATGDRARLLDLLHPDFHWTSHTGEQLDRESYVQRNTGGANRWSGQRLTEVAVTVDRRTAVLRCLVLDTVDVGGGPEEFRMPMTQVWVRRDARWVCLAGHAGPRL